MGLGSVGMGEAEALGRPSRGIRGQACANQGCSEMLKRAGPRCGHGWAACGAGAAPLQQPPLLERCQESSEAAPGSWPGEEPPVAKVTFQFLLWACFPPY